MPLAAMAGLFHRDRAGFADPEAPLLSLADLVAPLRSPLRAPGANLQLDFKLREGGALPQDPQGPQSREAARLRDRRSRYGGEDCRRRCAVRLWNEQRINLVHCVTALGATEGRFIPMRYFFDYIENGEKSVDTEGVELVDDAAARAQASLWLSEIAGEVIPNDGQHAIVVEVRDAQGVIISSVGFSLASDNTGGHAPNIRQ